MNVFCNIFLFLLSSVFNSSLCDILQPDQRHDREGGCVPRTCHQSPLQDYRCQCSFLFFPFSPSLLSFHLMQERKYCLQKRCLLNFPCHFPQTTMLQAIERYMKQAIVDKVPSVSSSALVSSLVNKLHSIIFNL